MVHRFGAEFRRADESHVSALSLMAPVFELPLSDVVVVDGCKAVLECRVAATPAAELTWYVDNVEIRQTDDYQVMYTQDGWCRLVIRDVMLEDEGEYTVKAVNEAGTCISTAYLTVLRKRHVPHCSSPPGFRQCGGRLGDLRTKSSTGIQRRSLWLGVTTATTTTRT